MGKWTGMLLWCTTSCGTSSKAHASHASHASHTFNALRIDKLYITHGEWAAGAGGAKEGSSRGGEPFKRLPFDCCALTLRPFAVPVCTPDDGLVYDLEALADYVERTGLNPVTGQRLALSSLLRLSFSTRGAPGEQTHYCPVTLKAFGEHSHIVANRRSGHVYSAQGAGELFAAGTASGRDFYTDEPFTRADLVTLQDPKNVAARNVVRFDHVLHGATAASAEQPLRHSASSAATPPSSPPGKRMAARKRPKEEAEDGGAAASIADEEVVIAAASRDGKATLRTTMGDLHIVLYCTAARRTCYNFITLAKRGYYVGVPFHRLVPAFVVQGGDASRSGGAGGQSCWGPGRPFADELPGERGLSHDRRGILSMANRGPNTNTSQFFITFKALPHLDKSHPIFGRVIGNLPLLDAIEAVPVDELGTPREPITLLDVIIVEDPFAEAGRTPSHADGRAAPRQAAARVDPTLVVRHAKASPNTAATIGKYMKKGGA